MNHYIYVKVAPYALIKTILALYESKVYDYSITMEDNDLVIGIDRNVILRALYPAKSETFVGEKKELEK